MRTAVNIAVFYAGWFASVHAAAQGFAWVALAGGLAVVGFHLLITSDPASEVKLILAAGVVGALSEALLIGFGFAHYALSPSFTGAPPAWLVVLWMAFATTINVSLGWLKNNLLLAGILGMVLAPASYYAGERLGGMALSEPRSLSLAAIALVWAAAFPLLVMLARRWTRRTN